MDGAPPRPGGVRLLAVLACVSVAVLAVYQCEGTGGPVHALRAAVRAVDAPLVWAGEQAARPFKAAGRALSDAAAGEGELEGLRRENEELTARLAELEELRVENESLRSMLAMASEAGLSGLGASVIGVSADAWQDTITIDRGSLDGVEAGMPVTDGAGAVGQVSAVGPTSSTVTLLTDSTSAASAMLQGSRATGVLRGSVDGSLHLEYVETSASVSVGDLVVTSGLGGAYPKGLLIGTVASVTSSPSDVYYSIVVAPAARQGSYEEVLVVTSFDAAKADAAAESLLADGLAADEAGDGAEAAP